MIDDFYLASIPEPVSILGFRLLPFSLGHLLLLHRYDSAFVTGGNPTYDDLALSVLVCAIPYSEGSTLRDDSSLPEFMRRWHDRITSNDALSVKLGFRKAGVIDLQKECDLFSGYLAAHSKMPYYSYKPGDFREMKCPMVQMVKVRLMRDMHFNEREIMDRPWALCLWDFVTLKALNNEVSMEDENDFKVAQNAGKELAEAIESGRFRLEARN